MTEQSRIRRIVKALFQLLDTDPSKQTLAAVSVLVIMSYSLGMAQGQGTIGETTPVDCKDLTNYSDKAYPDLEPRYDEDLGVCVVPEPLYNDSTPTNYSELSISGPINQTQ